MKTLNILPALLAACVLWSSPLFAADVYDLDVAHTNLGFGAKHMLVSTVKGNFNEFSGQFTVDPKGPALEGLELTVQAASIDTGINKRDDHLRSADFFEVDKFPRITFKSTRVEKKGEDIILHGDLTMKDVTKAVALPVTLSGPVKDPGGNTRFGLEGAVKINRKDWHINFNATLDNGGLVVADEVRVEISLEGIRRK